MPAKRMIAPTFWKDYDLCTTCSRDARLLYGGMWCQADDQGVLPDDLPTLKIEIFPWDNDITVDRVGELREELVRARRAVRYVSNDKKPLIWLPKFVKNQKLDKVSRLYDGPSQETQEAALSVDGARAYRETLAAIDKRQDRYKKRQQPAVDGGEVKISESVLNAALALVATVGRSELLPVEVGTIRKLVSLGAKEAWIIDGLELAGNEEDRAKRSVRYAYGIVERYVRQGHADYESAPRNGNGRQAPAEQDDSLDEIIDDWQENT